MKKSKIIVPALAVLCLSTAAAVSGTVAWFTASRNASFTTSNLTVINPEGNLKYDLKSGANTTAAQSSGVGTAIAINDDVSLRDSSVKVTTDGITVYRAIIDETGKATAYQEVAESKAGVDGSYSQGKNDDDIIIAYAATWSCDFWVEGSGPEEYTVFFDAKKSDLVEPSATDVSIFNAYRCAMYTEDYVVVWSPNNGAGDPQYVDSTTAHTGVDTDVYPTYAKADNSATVSETTASGSTVRTTNTLGVCHTPGYGATGYKLTVNFVCWFDGLDPMCIESHLAALSSLTATATMAFVAIQTDNLAA